MGYLIKHNNRFIAKGGHTHGHPKTTLLKEGAKVYTTEKTATNSAKKLFGNTAIFNIEKLTNVDAHT